MKVSSILNYLLLIAVITIIMLLIYASVQQSYRTAANDPQIQIAEDFSEKIKHGRSADNFFLTDTINIANSLSPFVALYEASGHLLDLTGI